MGEVVQIRDYRRKEEQDEALVRLAREIMGLDAPCDLSAVWPDFQHTPEKDPA